MSKQKPISIEQFDVKQAEQNITNFQKRENDKEIERLNKYDISDILEAVQQDTNEGKLTTEYIYYTEKTPSEAEFDSLCKKYNLTKQQVIDFMTELKDMIQFDPEDYFGKAGKLQYKGFAVHLGAKDKDTMFIRVITQRRN